MRKPRNYAIATKGLNIGSVDKAWLKVRDMQGNEWGVELEDWQVEAIQQVLGLEKDGSDIYMWARNFVEARVRKMGRLSVVEMPIQIETEGDE